MRGQAARVHLEGIVEASSAEDETSRPRLARRPRLAGEKRLDPIALRLRVRLADLDQRLQVVGLEENQADDVRARGATRTETTREIPEETRQSRLELAGHPTEIDRRPQNEDVDDPHSVPLRRGHSLQE